MKWEEAIRKKCVAAMEARDISQASLAKRLKISRPHLCRWLAGDKSVSPSLKWAGKVTRHLKIDVDVD